MEVQFHSQSPPGLQPASGSTWGRAGGWRGQQSVGRSRPWTRWRPGTSRSPHTRSARLGADSGEKVRLLHFNWKAVNDTLLSFFLLEETKWLPPFLQLSVVQKRLFSWTFPAGTQARTLECTTPGGISTNWVNGGQNIKTYILLSVMENDCTRWIISVVKAWLLLLQFLSFPSLMESD